MSIVGPSEARPADGLAVDFVVESDRAQLSEIVQRVRDGRLRTTSAPSRPSTKPSPPSTRPSDARGRRSSASVREDSEGERLYAVGRSLTTALTATALLAKNCS